MGDFKFFVFFALSNWAVIDSGCSEKEGEEFRFLSSKKNLIIDTDAGVDDGVAILNLLGAEELFQEIQVKLITTVNGNTCVENVAKNVLKILKTANRLDIPVYKGASESIVVTPKVDNFYGKDGFGDFDFPDPPLNDLIKKRHAVNALIEATNSNPGLLTLLCLGPLTNIALAARLDEKFFRNLREIYVLGGSDTGVGNIRPGIEFNFHVDPEAAVIVLKEARKSNKTLNLLTWETAAVRSVVDMKWRKEILGFVKSAQVDLINKAENHSLNRKNWISSDTLLSSVILDSKVVESSDLFSADVETCGQLSRGGLFIDYHCNTNLTENIRIIRSVNTDLFKEMLLQNLNPHGGEKNGSSNL